MSTWTFIFQPTIQSQTSTRGFDCPRISVIGSGFWRSWLGSDCPSRWIWWFHGREKTAIWAPCCQSCTFSIDCTRKTLSLGRICRWIFAHIHSDIRSLVLFGTGRSTRPHCWCCYHHIALRSRPHLRKPVGIESNWLVCSLFCTCSCDVLCRPSGMWCCRQNIWFSFQPYGCWYSRAQTSRCQWQSFLFRRCKRLCLCLRSIGCRNLCTLWLTGISGSTWLSLNTWGRRCTASSTRLCIWCRWSCQNTLRSSILKEKKNKVHNCCSRPKRGCWSMLSNWFFHHKFCTKASLNHINCILRFRHNVNRHRLCIWGSNWEWTHFRSRISSFRTQCHKIGRIEFCFHLN